MLHSVEVLHRVCGDTRVSSAVFTAGKDVAEDVHHPRSINFIGASQDLAFGQVRVRQGAQWTGSCPTDHICLGVSL